MLDTLSRSPMRMTGKSGSGSAGRKSSPCGGAVMTDDPCRAGESMTRQHSPFHTGKPSFHERGSEILRDERRIADQSFVEANRGSETLDPELSQGPEKAHPGLLAC